MVFLTIIPSFYQYIKLLSIFPQQNNVNILIQIETIQICIVVTNFLSKECKYYQLSAEVCQYFERAINITFYKYNFSLKGKQFIINSKKILSLIFLIIFVKLPFKSFLIVPKIFNFNISRTIIIFYGFEKNKKV